MRNLSYHATLIRPKKKKKGWLAFFQQTQFFFLFDVFIYLYLGLVGGDKTYKIDPPDPITLSK